MDLTTASLSTQPPPPPPAYPEAPWDVVTYLSLMTLIKVVIGGGVAVFGVVSNIFNILVFYRQGPLSNSSTVVFMALALTDFFVCLFHLITACFAIVRFYFTDHANSKWSPSDLATVYFQRPMNFLIQFTCYITCFLAFERAVSVVFPFRAKSIFTPKRCVGVVVVLFLIIFTIHIPDMFNITAKWHVDRIVFTPTLFFNDTLNDIYCYLGHIAMRIFAILFVIACNIIIIWKVKSSQKFRSSKANIDGLSGPKKQDKSMAVSKDIKLTRLIVTISVVYTTCYILSIPHILLTNIFFKPHVDYNWSVDTVTSNIMLAFQVFNSSINIVIYYNMSARFKDDIHKLWAGCSCKKQ